MQITDCKERNEYSIDYCSRFYGVHNRKTNYRMGLGASSSGDDHDVVMMALSENRAMGLRDNVLQVWR